MPGDDEGRPPPGDEPAHIEALRPTEPPTSRDSNADTPYQLLPPLTSDEYAALKADIQTNGVLVPVIVDQHGVIIDGHHRQQIADELGIPCERKVREFASDQERYDFALGLNLKRRHLNREQMRQLIASECDRTPEASDREIARRLGCDHKTVGAVRRPVDNLSTPEVGKFPTLTRQEAEELTEQIRRQLDQGDRACIELLTLGVSPADVATAVMQAWAGFSDHTNDAEFNDAMWRHIVSPRVQAILKGEWSA